MTEIQKDVFKATTRLANLTALLATTDARTMEDLAELARIYTKRLTEETPLPEEDVEKLFKEAVLPLIVACNLLSDWNPGQRGEEA